MRLNIDEVNKRYDQHNVLNDVQIDLESGEIACLVGPSGCGKTTLLRCVAGFEAINGGVISLNDQIVSTADQLVSSEKRGIGMVFQDHSLFPHLNISKNVEFGLHQWSKTMRQKRVAEVLELVGLEQLAKRFPHQLSGGQQQRAALARALAYQPKLLLMDEPFSSLDQDLRKRLAVEVSDILHQSQTTTLWVTHDQNEAMQAADVMGVMSQGRVLQWDAPDTIYHHPANRFVAEFLGECAFLLGEIVEHGRVKTALGELKISEQSNAVEVGDTVDVLVRANQLVEANEGPEAVVSRTRFEGDHLLYYLEFDGQTLLMRTPSFASKKPGQTIKLAWQESLATVYRQT